MTVPRRGRWLQWRQRTASRPDRPPALVIAGMHRSGTSLVASACQAAGVWLGDRQIPPTQSNPLGHFEDLDFYDINRRALLANDADEDGLSVPGRLVVPPAVVAEATALVADRMAHGRAWGWKDPRTTLLLDFWAECVPEATFLLLFRRPWDVIDSLYRRGDVAIARNPRLALDLWCEYNERICRFAAAHPHRVLVRETQQFIGNSVRVLRAVRRRLGARISARPRVYRQDLFHALPERECRRLFALCAPDALAVYRRLRWLAGNPLLAGTWGPPTRSRFLEPLLCGWARRAAGAVDVDPAAVLDDHAATRAA